MGSTGHGSGSLREFGTKGVWGTENGGGRAEKPRGESSKSRGISETGGTIAIEKGLTGGSEEKRGGRLKPPCRSPPQPSPRVLR